MRAGRGRSRLAQVLGIGLIAGLVVAGCTTSEPTLLDKSDFHGVVQAVHNEDGAYAPGWTWCTALSPTGYFRPAPTSYFSFGDRTLAGATIIDRSDDGAGADDMLSIIEGYADVCLRNETAAENGNTIEPLTGLDADTVGWRTEASDGAHGEFAVVRLNDSRLLAVGWATYEPETPVPLDELIRLAREGASQFEPDHG